MAPKIALAALMLATCWAVSEWISIWLVPAYLLVMGLILLPGQPVAGSDKAGLPPAPILPVEPTIPDPAVDQLSQADGAASEAGSIGTDPGPKGASKRGRGRPRKVAKLVVEPSLVVEATWIEVGPGKFVRADAPTTPPVAAATTAPDAAEREAVPDGTERDHAIEPNRGVEVEEARRESRMRGEGEVTESLVHAATEGQGLVMARGLGFSAATTDSIAPHVDNRGESRSWTHLYLTTGTDLIAPSEVAVGYLGGGESGPALPVPAVGLDAGRVDDGPGTGGGSARDAEGCSPHPNALAIERRPRRVPSRRRRVIRGREVARANGRSDRFGRIATSARGKQARERTSDRGGRIRPEGRRPHPRSPPRPG